MFLSDFKASMITPYGLWQHPRPIIHFESNIPNLNLSSPHMAAKLKLPTRQTYFISSTATRTPRDACHNAV
jgi:hypothetical protein